MYRRRFVLACRCSQMQDGLDGNDFLLMLVFDRDWYGWDGTLIKAGSALTTRVLNMALWLSSLNGVSLSMKMLEPLFVASSV